MVVLIFTLYHPLLSPHSSLTLPVYSICIPVTISSPVISSIYCYFPVLHIPQGNMTDPHNPYHHILPTHRIFISIHKISSPFNAQLHPNTPSDPNISPYLNASSYPVISPFFNISPYLNASSYPIISPFLNISLYLNASSYPIISPFLNISPYLNASSYPIISPFLNISPL
jgi:hypothetical protein